MDEIVNLEINKTVFDIHSLRVSGITNLIEAGVTVEIVSQFVSGHSSTVMTLYYNKNSIEEITTAIDKLHNEKQLDFIKGNVKRYGVEIKINENIITDILINIDFYNEKEEIKEINIEKYKNDLNKVFSIIEEEKEKQDKDIEFNDLNIDISKQKKLKIKNTKTDINQLLEKFYKENLEFSKVNNFINSLAKSEDFNNKNYEQNRTEIKQEILSRNLIEKNKLIDIKTKYSNKQISLTNDEVKEYNHKLEKIIELEDFLNGNKGSEGPELS